MQTFRQLLSRAEKGLQPETSSYLTLSLQTLILIIGKSKDFQESLN